jgi:hypothetical protein
MLHNKKPKLTVFPVHEMSRETVEALEYLLREALEGNIRGVAFVVMHRGLEYSTGVVGSFNSSRPLARGLVLELYDQVANK